MFCPRCHTELKDNTRFCGRCGIDLKKKKNNYSTFHSNTFSIINRYSINDRQYKFVKKYSEINKENTNNNNNNNNDKQSHKEQFEYSNTYSKTNIPYISSDEDYIKTYVGDNYEFLKDSNNSFFSLIFGPLYLLYRKLNFIGILLIILLLIIYYLFGNIIGFAALIIVNITLMFKFKELYSNHVKKRVELIKNKNSDKSSIEIINICKHEGGTTSIGKMIIQVLGIIILIIFIDIATIINIEEIEETKETEEFNYKIKEMNYTIPGGYSSNNNNNLLYHFYSYHNENNNCYIHIKTNNVSLKIDEYINNKNKYNNYNTSEVKDTTINNINWKYQELNKETDNKEIYVTNHNNTYYDITIENTDNNKKCKEIKNKILNSINFN